MPERDAIVVGAGFTGLSAALELVDAGLDVLLLEARDRVGGKVESETLPDGTRVDTGGQFFCRDMSELMAVIEENGKTPVLTHYDGEMIYRPPVSPQQGFARWQGVDALRDRMIATDPDDPDLAKLTVADWVARQDDVAPDVRKKLPAADQGPLVPRAGGSRLHLARLERPAHHQYLFGNGNVPARHAACAGRPAGGAARRPAAPRHAGDGDRIF
ncbi:FAD-dependent oxidoreductase (plasmid) [Neorhizobium galegae]|nr:FAD-dependent oxidoreductase [Neorhizobium galegae]